MRTQEFDFSVNLMRSILWQYEGAPKIVALSRADQDYLDRNHEKFWTDWIRDVFDLSTANEFGLSVWARILDTPVTISNVSRRVNVWGFGVNNKNFGHGGFGRAEDANSPLDTESARKLLKLRWFSLTMRPTVPNINQVLSEVFGEGVVWVIDPYDMTFITYMFSAAPDYKVRQLLDKTGILPRPSTVGTQWIVQPRPAWGFGPNHRNFGNGSFGT
jgi:hypothetical protein